MDYREAVRYIEEISKFTKKHPLEHTRELLKRLGNPAEDRRIIHVAGTNGKGSVCAYINAILMAEGKHVGFFTSPHLVSINERIQVDGRPIDDATFLHVFEQVLPSARQMEEEGLGHPSYFEFLYAMGMKAFSETAAEYLVLETGLGGRLDATNSAEKPFLCVITSVSLDHTEILGDTVEQIAWEKAGIIKSKVPVIYDGSCEKVAAIIRKRAKELHAPCREISKNAFEIRELTPKSIAFSRMNAYDRDITWRLPVCGVFQVMNAAIALEAAMYALEGQAIHLERWQRALAQIRWEGRMEEAAPHLVIDGAHNPGAVRAFTETLHALYPAGMEPPVIVFAAAADKKYEEMIACLCESLDAKAYVVTQIEDGRRASAEDMARVFARYTDKKIIIRKELKEALYTAMEEREDGTVYCIGSLYLVGMIKKLLAGGEYHAEF